MLDVALLTCRRLPALDDDERLLVPVLESRGLSTAPVVWDDPAFDWTGARLCLVRSVWDYHLRRDAFLAWMDALPGHLQVWNPPATIRWNSHKSYLADLERRGIPIVPTAWFARGDAPDLAAVAEENGWDGIVVKPVVSASGHRTTVVRRDDVARGQAHLDALLADADAMVQEYMPAVGDYGERSIVAIDGEITHGLRKTTVFDPAFEDRPVRVEVADAEADLARATLAAAGMPWLYARVDMVPAADGIPRLMELEMFEPSLYFADAMHAAERLADGVEALLGAFG